jgi:hypothetical protein
MVNAPVTLEVFVTEFMIPASSGGTEIADFFAAKKVEVAPILEVFLRHLVGRNYVMRTDLPCRVNKKLDDGAGTLIGSLGLSYLTDMNAVCTTLRYLGGDGKWLLDIPQGQTETNVFLGYVKLNHNRIVLYVEHEIENGVDTIEIHAKAANHRERGTLLVLRTA